ncbi:MAG: hypothetical protein NWQ96_07690, partial [Candidatus Nanopelagicales bacterium]|nr:hypothetical protein [Candidatus Nanopelagicales bacterium]
YCTRGVLGDAHAAMTLRMVASVPATALLVPAIAAGAAEELSGLRAAALNVTRELNEACDEVVVLAGTPAATHISSIPAQGWGTWAPVGYVGVEGLAPNATPTTDSRQVPVPIMVAAWLLNSVHSSHRRSYFICPTQGFGTDTAPGTRELNEALNRHGQIGLLVVADGSCCRGPKAPGSEVLGAIEHDAELTDALTSVNTDWFTHADRNRDAAAFGSQGLGAWALAAEIASGSGRNWHGEVRHLDDPYGVLYAVADWQPVVG